MQSPTTLKDKWNSFKVWFTPVLPKRRPSQCSTTSTNTTTTTASTSTTNAYSKEDILYNPSNTKRPSIPNSLSNEGVFDKCMSSFLRRPSNGSCVTSTSTINDDMDKEIEKLYELYNFAMDEISYAEDSRGSPYYQGDRISAQEAIDQCTEYYESLLQQYTIDRSISYKISTLNKKMTTLPVHDDQLSF